MMDRSVRIRFYADLAAARHCCTRADVLGRKRKPHFVEARREVMRRLDAAGWNGLTIARWMGLHHTSVMYGLGKLSRQPSSSRFCSSEREAVAVI